MIRPANDFVFVREIVETVSQGGIILAGMPTAWSAERQEHKEGVVVAVGPGRWGKRGRESMWGLEPGQRIAFSPNGNHRQEIDGEELIVLRRDSVIGEVRT